MEKIKEFATEIFKAQPFNEHLRAELTNIGPQSAEISIEVGEYLLQHQGIVHGGVLSYLADTSLAFAGAIALGRDIRSSEFKINFLRPGIGSHLIARAEAKNVGKRQAVCVCEIFSIQEGKEVLCALAQGTIVATK